MLQPSQHHAIPWIVSYSEASFFDGFHFHHIAAWEQWKRLRALNEKARRAALSSRYRRRAA
jgi:hypothetical protein